MRLLAEQALPRRLTARRLGFLLLVSLGLGALLFTQIDRLDVYKRYLTDRRPAARLDFYNLGDTWTEQTLRQAFPGIRVSCYRYTETRDADRVCALDSESLNGIPTLYTAFFFSFGKLSHASINVPWWALADARHILVSSYGPPTASQRRPHKGLRLEGWQLGNGSALFINRDRPLYPLEWNAVLWNSQSTCRKLGCFNP